jgi:hypothetical protein
VTRIASNRDESRTRPAALPPEIRQFGPRRAILPIDPLGGGTWIAVNDAGLALMLLNSNPARPGQTNPVAREGAQHGVKPRSRGLIIPGLLHCATLEETLAEFARMDLSAYPPFRLVVTDGISVEEVGRSRHVLAPDRLPVMFASSGLGDALVDAPRRELLHEHFARAGDMRELQDTYHRHHWPHRPELSVCMSRADARTVSFTTIEIAPERVAMWYDPELPDLATEPILLSRPRQ